MNSSDAHPKFSVVVVCYEMAAQIENSLRSLLPPYQRNIEVSDYEIIPSGARNLSQGDGSRFLLSAIFAS